MMVEIRGVSFVNKGAELMLYAILQKISEQWPNADFVMEPRGYSTPYAERAKLGLYQKPMFPEHELLFNLMRFFIPDKLWKQYGVVYDSEVDVVLDASGFAYSDQMGEKKSILLAKAVKKWKRQGTKIILLPQAFGPFSSPTIRNAVKVIVEHTDIIFARDKISYDYLTEVAGERENIKIAPDFTNLVNGIFPESFDRNKNRFCIVPNQKMIDSTSPEKSALYVPFLISCLKILKEKGENPFLLVHCRKDADLAKLVVTGFGEPLEIVFESNPLVIKGILGACSGVISSRFHGLVSALSQGVPSLATGWSHKYKMLFEEYRLEDGLIEPGADISEIKAIINKATDADTRQSIREKLKARSEDLKKKKRSYVAGSHCFDKKLKNVYL